MTIRYILLSWVWLAALGQAWAQDPHFSQALALPMWNNPAATGQFEGHTRLSSGLRQQWTGLPAGYRTQFLAVDAGREGLGYGLTLLQEQAGTAGYRHLQAAVNLALHRPVGPGTLSLGATAGLVQQRLDPDGLTFDSQYDPVGGFDPLLPSGEFLVQNQVIQPDLGVGLRYHYQAPAIARLMDLEAGFSLHHLNQPNLSLLGGEALLPRRTAGYLSAQWLAGGRSLLHTGLRYAQQGTAREWWAEAGLRYEVEPEVEVYAGLGWRRGDAWVPMIALTLNQVQVGLAYDLTFSKLGTAIGRRGGPELRVSWRLGAPAKPLHDYYSRQTRSRRRQDRTWYQQAAPAAAPAPITLVVVVPPPVQPDTVAPAPMPAAAPISWAPILFAVDDATIDPAYYGVLDQLAAHLRARPGSSILLNGHTDDEGSAWYNFGLGQKRAQAVSLYLSARGIAPERITTMSYGELRPHSPNRDADSRARNRRTEILLYP